MVNYITSSPYHNNHHHCNHNHLNNSTCNHHYNYHNYRESGTCCGLPTNHLAFLVSVFNFILFFSGLIILTIVILYETPPFDDGSGTYLHLPAIRSFLQISHPLNLLYYQLIICGGLVCTIAAINLCIDCYFSLAQNKDEDREINQHDLDEIALTLTSQHDTTRQSVSSSQESSGHFPSIALCLFIFVLLMLFTIQLCMSIFAFISVYGSSDEGYKKEFENSITEYLGKPKEILQLRKPLFDRLQAELKCCGLIDYGDYNSSLTGQLTVPETCCKTRMTKCSERIHPNNIYFDGCAEKMAQISGEHTLLLGWIAFALAVIEIFALLFSCCLYVQIVTKR